jgi:alkylated DNA repair dioxygenase AlkB
LFFSDAAGVKRTPRSSPPAIDVQEPNFVELQADLFGAPVARHPARPEGFASRAGVLSAAEERALVRRLATLPFKPYEFKGYFGNRRVAGFGYRYDQERRIVELAEPIPDFLRGLCDQVTTAMGLRPTDFVQALVNEYSPGAGIGWHRDRPSWGVIVGLSLLSPCTLRLRRKIEDRWERASAVQHPRSAYVLSGAARRDWEHSITPMTELRYSVTFRTLAERPGWRQSFAGYAANSGKPG